NMTAILATNQGRADFAWGTVCARAEEIPSVAPGDAPGWGSPHNAPGLDVREPGEDAGGDVPGAVSIPPGGVARPLQRNPRQRDVLVACQGGTRSLASARFLKALGYERVANLQGGTQGWIDAGNPVSR